MNVIIISFINSSRQQEQEREEFGLDSFDVNDFKLLNGTGGVYDRRDGVNDGDMHIEMLDAMVSQSFFV